MLDLNLILALSQACAPQAAPQTMAAIAWTESRFDPLAIGVNRGPRPARRARDAADAARIARSLLARGANLDLGLAQINNGNLDWLGLSVEAAFDPCRNLSAAGVVLRAGYRPSQDGDRQAALRVALSRYNTGHPRRGFRNGYVARVERAAVALSLAPSPPAADTAAAEAPVVARPAPPAPSSRTPETPAWDVFGRARFSATLAFAPSDPSWRDPR